MTELSFRRELDFHGFDGGRREQTPVGSPALPPLLGYLAAIHIVDLSESGYFFKSHEKGSLSLAKSPLGLGVAIRPDRGWSDLGGTDRSESFGYSY